jgi:glutamyl-tRNA reductase
MGLSQTCHQALRQDSAEQIRRREVSRILKKMDLSSEEEEVIERFSYSLVAKLLIGPISKVMARR